MTVYDLTGSKAMSGNRLNRFSDEPNVDWGRYQYERMRGTPSSPPKRKTPAELRELSDQFRKAANEALTEALKIEREELELTDEYGPRLK
jgi:hypothetical protein